MTMATLSERKRRPTHSAREKLDIYFYKLARVMFRVLKRAFENFTFYKRQGHDGANSVVARHSSLGAAAGLP